MPGGKKGGLKGGVEDAGEGGGGGCLQGAITQRGGHVQMGPGGRETFMGKDSSWVTQGHRIGREEQLPFGKLPEFETGDWSKFGGRTGAREEWGGGNLGLSHGN